MLVVTVFVPVGVGVTTVSVVSRDVDVATVVVVTVGKQARICKGNKIGLILWGNKNFRLT